MDQHIRYNHRHKKALQPLLLGNYEDPRSIPGIGEKTWNELLDWGFVEFGTCPHYGVDGYKITEDGQEFYRKWTAWVRGKGV